MDIIEDSLYYLLPTLDDSLFDSIFKNHGYFSIIHRSSEFELIIDFRFLLHSDTRTVQVESLNNIKCNNSFQKSISIFNILYNGKPVEFDCFIREKGYKGIEEFQQFLNDLDDFLRTFDKNVLRNIK